jgi:hypothetical protein
MVVIREAYSVVLSWRLDPKGLRVPISAMRFGTPEK